MKNLFGPGERPVHFPVSHGTFIGTGEIIVIRHSDVCPCGTQFLVKSGDDLPLHPLRVIETFLPWRAGGDIPISGITSVMCELKESSAIKELIQFGEVILSPPGSESGAVPMGGGFSRRGDHVLTIAYASA